MDLTGALPLELISDKRNPSKTLNGKDTLKREIPAILEDEDIAGQGRSIRVDEGPEAETD